MFLSELNTDIIVLVILINFAGEQYSLRGTISVLRINNKAIGNQYDCTSREVIFFRFDICLRFGIDIFLC